RVGIVGTSSALAALAADACRAVELTVPELPALVQADLTDLVGTSETQNPVDLGPVSAPGRLEAALRLVAASGEVDALLVLVTPHPDVASLAAAVLSVARDVDLPVLASYLGHDGVPPALSVPDEGGTPGAGSVPSYASPESAALALARACSHAEWRARPQGVVPVLDRVDLAPTVRVVAEAAHDGAWLPDGLAAEVLSGVGLSVWPGARVQGLAAAQVAAEGLGWPVAVKSSDDRWRGRVDVGAVRLGLGSPEALAAAVEAVEELTGTGELIVQPMAPSGVSVVVRLVQDAAVGPLLSLRLGGVVADLLADPLTRTLPLTDVDARDLVHGLRGSALLTGVRGGPVADVDALTDLLLRVARLGEDVPEVAEVLLDPVLVGASGITLLHAGVRLLPPEADPEAGPRRLTGRGAAYLR
ncbi:MAG: CoA-binding domain protein, partial [Frankiales bacterium]|nr:CoA-binding domain protein [Frankiales bacterium]